MDIKVVRDGTQTVITEEEIRDINECMGIISTSMRGNIPYARDMGFEGLPDNNSFEEKNEYLGALEEQLENWDTRYEVRGSMFTDDEHVTVEVRLNGE